MNKLDLIEKISSNNTQIEEIKKRKQEKSKLPKGIRKYRRDLKAKAKEILSSKEYNIYFKIRSNF